MCGINFPMAFETWSLHCLDGFYILARISGGPARAIQKWLRLLSGCRAGEFELLGSTRRWIQECVDFVRNFKSFTNGELVAAVFDKFPALSQDRNVWSTILALVECFSFRDAAQIAIHSDRELKMNACEQYSGYLECLSDSLAMDRDFLQQVIELDPDALCMQSSEWGSSASVSGSLDRWKKPETLPCWSMGYSWPATTLSSHRSKDKSVFCQGLVHAWLEIAFRQITFQNLFGQKQIFLWLAQYGKENPFRYTSDRLKCDATFVLQVVELQPYSFHFVSEEI